MLQVDHSLNNIEEKFIPLEKFVPSVICMTACMLTIMTVHACMR